MSNPPNPHHVKPCGPDEVYDSGGDPQANAIIDAIDRLTEAVKAHATTHCAATARVRTYGNDERPVLVIRVCSRPPCHTGEHGDDATGLRWR